MLSKVLVMVTKKPTHIEGFHKFGNKGSDKKMSFFSKDFIKEQARDSGVGTALINLCIPYLTNYKTLNEITRKLINEI